MTQKLLSNLNIFSARNQHFTFGHNILSHFVMLLMMCYAKLMRYWLLAKNVK